MGHFCISGVFSNSHRSSPSPHPTNNVGRVYPEFFGVSRLYRVGGGRTARNFPKGCTVLRENREMTEKYEYCSTVPRTFVQDCRSLVFPLSQESKRVGDREVGKKGGALPPPPFRLPMPFSAAATQASSPQNTNPRAPRCFSGEQITLV